MKTFSAVLLVIGGINWGLVGLFQFNLVSTMFGGDATLMSRSIYTLVGVSALYQLFNYPWGRRTMIGSMRESKKAA